MEQKPTPRNWESITSGILRFDGVVPLVTDSASSEIELFHFLVGNFDLLLVAALVEACRDAQTTLCPGSSNKAPHGCQVSQRMSGPVAADRTKQTMICRIPFRRATRIVTHRNRQARIIAEPLEFPFPQTRTTAVRRWESHARGRRRVWCTNACRCS